MLVDQDTVVHIHYTLKNAAGLVLNSSAGGDPLAYLHGNGNLVSGLEKALAGKAVGDKFTVAVLPEEGYGVRDEALVQQVPRSAFGAIDTLAVGMQFQAESNEGPRSVIITQIEGDMVTVDGNHPLADQTLNFDIEITAVRAATSEELEHGHVHGAGGHHH